MDQYRHLDFLRVTESAALAASKWVGKGQHDEADQAACEAMRTELNNMEMDATIVIGEGERDEAPMLYIGEKLGRPGGPIIQLQLTRLKERTFAPTALRMRSRF